MPNAARGLVDLVFFIVSGDVKTPASMQQVVVVASGTTTLSREGTALLLFDLLMSLVLPQ